VTVVDHERDLPTTDAARAGQEAGTRQPTADEHSPADTAARISNELSRLFRCGARMKSEIAGDHLGGRDLPTLVVVHRLAEDGPLRASALAERVRMDPSQVSRAVAGLVREGAVERRADPHDGRATLLVATDTGRSMADRFARARAAYVGSVVSDWDPADSGALAAGLARFVDGLERLVLPREGRPRDLSDDDAAPAAPTTTPSTTTTPSSTPDARKPGEAVNRPEAATPGAAQ